METLDMCTLTFSFAFSRYHFLLSTLSRRFYLSVTQKSHTGAAIISCHEAGLPGAYLEAW